jgi:hypothetical protein
MAEKERDYGTREQRGCGEERMRKKKKKKSAQEDALKIEYPMSSCLILSSASLYIPQGKYGHMSEGEIKRMKDKAYLHCVRAYVFVCLLKCCCFL